MVICLYSKKAVWQLNCDSHIQQKAVSVLRAEPITTVTTATDSTPTVQRFRVQYRNVSVLHEVSNSTVTLEPTAKRLPYTSPTPHIQTHQFAIQYLPPTPTPTDPTADDPPPHNTAHQRTPTAVLAHTQFISHIQFVWPDDEISTSATHKQYLVS